MPLGTPPTAGGRMSPMRTLSPLRSATNPIGAAAARSAPTSTRISPVRRTVNPAAPSAASQRTLSPRTTPLRVPSPNRAPDASPSIRAPVGTRTGPSAVSRAANNSGNVTPRETARSARAAENRKALQDSIDAKNQAIIEAESKKSVVDNRPESYRAHLHGKEKIRDPVLEAKSTKRTFPGRSDSPGTRTPPTMVSDTEGLGFRPPSPRMGISGSVRQYIREPGNPGATYEDKPRRLGRTPSPTVRIVRPTGIRKVDEPTSKEDDHPTGRRYIPAKTTATTYNYSVQVRSGTSTPGESMEPRAATQRPATRPKEAIDQMVKKQNARPTTPPKIKRTLGNGDYRPHDNNILDLPSGTNGGRLSAVKDAPKSGLRKVADARKASSGAFAAMSQTATPRSSTPDGTRSSPSLRRNIPLDPSAAGKRQTIDRRSSNGIFRPPPPPPKEGAPREPLMHTVYGKCVPMARVRSATPPSDMRTNLTVVGSQSLKTRLAEHSPRSVSARGASPGAAAARGTSPTAKQDIAFGQRKIKDAERPPIKRIVGAKFDSDAVKSSIGWDNGRNSTPAQRSFSPEVKRRQAGTASQRSSTNVSNALFWSSK